MNKKRYFIASLAAFVLIFIFEWVFHGSFLKGMYDATMHLWRGEEDCIFWAMILGQLMFPFIFTYIFTKGYENKGVGEGIRFGILIGLLFIPSNLIWYAVMPIPFELAICWSIGGVIEMMFCGVVVAAIYKN